MPRPVTVLTRPSPRSTARALSTVPPAMPYSWVSWRAWRAPDSGQLVITSGSAFSKSLLLRYGLGYNRTMQSETGRARPAEGVRVDWPTCGEGDTSGCTGAQVEAFGRCWAHLSREELRQALSSLAPGNNLDLRGTTLDGRLLGQILSAFRDSHSGKPLIGDVSLENARISGEAPFGSAVFNGRARFFGAKFVGKADFYGAEFKSYAGFNGAEFEYADFEKAKFSGDSVSFKYVKFRGPAEFGGRNIRGVHRVHRR